MPEYKYLAKAEEGDGKKEGKIRAESRGELARNLKKEGFFLIEAEEIEGKREKKSFFSFSKKVSPLEKVLFTRNLAVMLSSGLSLSKALTVLSEQTNNKKFKSVILDIRSDIMMGNTFSKSLEKHPEIFSEVFRNMMRLSEESGTMEENLKILTKQIESEYELRSKIKGALIYPAIIVSAMLGIGVIFLVVFIPQLATTFDSMGAELPVFTQIIVTIGTFLSENWYFIPIFIVIIFYLFRAVIKTKKGKSLFDSLLLRIPIISTVVKKSNAAHVTKTMGALLASGVPVVRCMEILSKSTSNTHFAKSVSDSIKVIEKGGRLSKAFLPYGHLYGTMTVQMLEVGDETGQTTKMLFKIAEFLEEEVMNMTKNLATILEPILMILIGVAIGVFALAVILPIYSMLDYV